MLVDVDTYGRCGYLQSSVYVDSAKVSCLATCRFDKYLCRRCSQRVAYYPTLIVAKHTQNVVAIEVEGHLSAVGVVDLDCVRIDLRHIFYCKCLIGLCDWMFNHKPRAKRNGVDALWHECHSGKSEGHCQSNRRMSRLL